MTERKRDPSRMRGFWDRKAEENPWWYVASSVDYDNPDTEFFFRTGEEHVREILAFGQIEPAPGTRVLEIGCGAGRMTRALAGTFEEVWALDVSERMIELGRRTLAEVPNIRWLVGSGVDLSGAPDDFFDAVVSLRVFRHLPSEAILGRYLAEAARVLRDGATFVFETATERRGLGWRARMLALWAHDLVRRRGPRGLWSPYFRGTATPPERLRVLLAQAGFRIVRERGMGTHDAWVAATRLPRAAA